jgi:hypothetical protein
MKAILGLGIVLLLLAGCSSGPPRVQHEEKLDRYLSYAGEPVDRANSFRLDSWELVDRDKIVLWTGVNEAYLVTVYDTCRNLQYTNHIRVVSSMGSSISRFDKVKVDGDTCPIREIRPIDVERMKADMAAGRAPDTEAKEQP